MRHAEARAAAGGGDHLDLPLRPPDPADNHGFGACHAAEIPFVFDTVTRASRPLIGDTPSQAVADRTHAVWVAFVTTGDPGWARIRRGAADHRAAG